MPNGFGGYRGAAFGYNPWVPRPIPWSGLGPWGMSPWGLGGLRTWGGTYSPQFISTGVPTDEEITEMIYDALDADPMVPYDADIDVDVKDGEVTLTGTVPNKRVKYAAGDDAWWVPGVVDVNNNLQIAPRRRARSAPPESEETAERGRRARRR